VDRAKSGRTGDTALTLAPPLWRHPRVDDRPRLVRHAAFDSGELLVVAPALVEKDVLQSVNGNDAVVGLGHAHEVACPLRVGAFNTANRASSRANSLSARAGLRESSRKGLVCASELGENR